MKQLLIFCLLLTVNYSLFAQEKTRSQLQTEITTQLPSNITHAITALNVRNCTGDMLNNTCIYNLVTRSGLQAMISGALCENKSLYQISDAVSGGKVIVVFGTGTTTISGLCFNLTDNDFGHYDIGSDVYTSYYGGWISIVTHDSTLTGDGTSGSPLSVISGGGGGSGWLLTGNSGTNPDINWIGTNDFQPLIFKMGGNRVGFIDGIADDVSFGSAMRTGREGNTALGQAAGSNDTAGQENTYIGWGAGGDNFTGHNLTFVGQGTDVTVDGLSNASAIGTGAHISQSNSLVLGNSVNVGIGTSTPNSTAILDMTSTTQGVLVPRMTTTNRTSISSPAEGLMVYDTTLHKLFVWDGSAWQAAW